jgi:hypothetical protein
MNRLLTILTLVILSVFLTACGDGGGDAGSAGGGSGGLGDMSSLTNGGNMDGLEIDADTDELMAMGGSIDMSAIMGGGGSAGAGANDTKKYRILGDINVTIGSQYGDPQGKFYQLHATQPASDTTVLSPTYRTFPSGYTVQIPAYDIKNDIYMKDTTPIYNLFRFVITDSWEIATQKWHNYGVVRYRLAYPSSVPPQYYPEAYAAYGFGYVNIMYVDATSYASVGGVVIGGYILADVFTNPEMTATKNVFTTFGLMIFDPNFN